MAVELCILVVADLRPDALRDGVAATYTGNGFSVPWDLSGLTEGIYSIRATLVDTLGRNDAVVSQVYVEPTPPLPPGKKD